MGPTDEGVTMYTPVSKKPEPLFGVPVREEDYSFVHGKFYQGDAYLDGDSNRQQMKNALTQTFGNPSFTNEQRKIWKWKWPKRSIENFVLLRDKVLWCNSYILQFGHKLIPPA
jgi:hypothetical protein